jgi:hypothetical protein
VPACELPNNFATTVGTRLAKPPVAMRVLNFFRTDPMTAPAIKAAAAEDTLGADAFASETPAADATANAPAAPGRTALLWTLAAVVLLQAAPTALWVKAQLQGATAAAAQQVAPPAAPVTVQAAVCEPVVPPAPAPEADVKTAAMTNTRAAAMPLAGSIAVAAPVPMRIFDGDRLVGTTEADSIMLSVGSHDLEFVNDEVGFRARRTVSVQPGRTTAIRLEAPRAPLHVNALPWAEVWIDNQRIGETPIGNLQQPIGPHEIVFRHPELGERRTTVFVTLKEPARVSMDLRKR